MSNETRSMEIHDKVRARYADMARQTSQSDCCGEAFSCCDESPGEITADLYSAEELAGIPDSAASISLGCGNPTLLADLGEGEVVLDLGSGGGIDVLLSARRVGERGYAYGLDMTDEMLDLARQNARKAGVSNVEFLKGQIEDIPLGDSTVDVIISNCVVNLSPDKARVLHEAFRVLKPGGRLAIADVVVRGKLPENVRRDAEAWAGCVAGALEESEYIRMLRETGFEDVDVVITREYTKVGLQQGCCSTDIKEGGLASAFICARKLLRG